jgi:hypothetical protein
MPSSLYFLQLLFRLVDDTRCLLRRPQRREHSSSSSDMMMMAASIALLGAKTTSVVLRMLRSVASYSTRRMIDSFLVRAFVRRPATR